RCRFCSGRRLSSRRKPTASPTDHRGQFFFFWILSAHCERDSAPRGKLRSHNRLAWRARFHEIVQNAVRDRFVERALVPIRGKVKLKRLTFDAEPIRHVIDVDPGEIRLTRDRTNG